MTSSLTPNKSEAAVIPPPAGRGAAPSVRSETHSDAQDATSCHESAWWPAAAETKICVNFGRPPDFFMTLPEKLAAVRGHLVRRRHQPILLHPRLKEHVLEAELSDNVVLRLSVDPLGCVYIQPVRPEGDLDDTEYAEIVKASESEWVQRKHTDDPYFLHGASSVWRLPRPKWPNESFETLLQMAMPGRIISDPAHPAIQSFLRPVVAQGARGFKGYRSYS